MILFSWGLFYGSGFEFLLIKKIDIGLESFSHINIYMEPWYFLPPRLTYDGLEFERNNGSVLVT
jgi:hypothetical protein